MTVSAFCRYCDDLSRVYEIGVMNLRTVRLINFGIAQPLAVGVLGDAPQIVAGLNVKGSIAQRRRGAFEGERHLTKRLAVRARSFEAHSIPADGDGAVKGGRPTSRVIRHATSDEPIIEINLHSG